MDNSDAFITLREAGQKSGYHPDYLSSLIRQGKLQGRKLGKTWVTTDAEVRRFLNGAAMTAADDLILCRLQSRSPVARCITVGLIILAVLLGLLAAYLIGFRNAMSGFRT
jgi:hypothetical protein